MNKITSTNLSQEQRILESFKVYVEEARKNDGFPKKAVQHLDGIMKTLEEMDSQALRLEELSSIRKIVERDIPAISQLYLSLPRAHAVSYILENGKTSKDTFIEKMSTLSQQVSDIWQEAVIEKTNSLLKKQHTAPTVVKKDFFDL